MTQRHATTAAAQTAFTRADFLRLMGLSGAAAGLSGALAGCGPVGAETGSVRVGYLPITDATPLLLAHANGLYADEGLEAPTPRLFRGWSELAEAFLARRIDVAHVLMPMAVWMRFAEDFPVKLVAWGHVDGSALTVGRGVNALGDLAGQTVAIPFWYSVHNLVLQLLLRKQGLRPILRGEPSATEGTVRLTVMAPPDMPPALANGAIAGYIVAEPFNAAAEVQGIGRVQRFTGDVWFEHACCVVVTHEENVERHPGWVQSVVNAVAKAQVFARENRGEAARRLADGYLPQPLPAVERAFSHYHGEEYAGSGALEHPDWGNRRIDFQPFPFASYTEELVRLFRETEVEGDTGFLGRLDPARAHEDLVSDGFAREAIKAAGGASRFGISESLSRSERISP